MAEFKIGNRVFSYSLQEWGTVFTTRWSDKLQIGVEFDSGEEDYFTNDGKLKTRYKTPDLYFYKVQPIPQEKLLKDKDIIKCWDDGSEFEQVYRFYDTKNNIAFSANGDRNGYSFDNMFYVPDEEAPQELVTLRDKLSD